MRMAAIKRIARSSGFTLIETLVVVFLLAILVALVIPAVQAAREASRRAQCGNNLKQLAIAMHQYEGVYGTLPMGTPHYRFADVGVFSGHSVFVALLDQLEQHTLYNSVNFTANIYTYVNQTVHPAAFSTLWCPSDSAVTHALVYGGDYLDIPDGKFIVSFSSYAACSGTWYHHTNNLPDLSRLTGQDNGVCFVNSSVRISEITDGTSHTFLLGERSHDSLNANRLGWHWWFDGYYGDTLFWTLYPINPRRVVPSGVSIGPQENPFIISAGSSHSGGANFAFADGSVRFIKDTIESWHSDYSDGYPTGVVGSPTTLYQLAPGTHLGVYQALSTRNGGESDNSKP